MPRTPQHIRDELLVIRCQQGDAVAFNELIGHWRQRLHRHAWALTRDREAAADVSQESWLAIARGIRRLDDPSAFPAWAYRIVSRRCADWVREEQRGRRLLEGAEHSARAQAAASRPHDASTDRIRAALAELDPDRRAILTFHYLDKMNVNQIATALDLPVGTVKSRLYHARAALRQAMERKTP